MNMNMNNASCYMIEQYALTSDSTEGIRLTHVVLDHDTNKPVARFWADTHDHTQALHSEYFEELPAEVIEVVRPESFDSFTREALHMLVNNLPYGYSENRELTEHGTFFDSYLVEEW